MIRKIGQALFSPPGAGDDGLNLRLWFVGFVAWLGMLAVLARLGLTGYESGSGLGTAIWLLSLYLFYLSLCCTFFPAPTMWIVMMLASNYVAGEVGVEAYPVSRMLLVASVGAWGTAMANLNEYHIFTFLLRHGRVANVRKTRLYEVAARWFGVRPFWTIVLFSFIPIPVDIIRWLAITYRYGRFPFFVAYYLGRWVRYAGLAAVTIWGALTWYHIVIVQCVVAAIALAKIVQQAVRQHRGARDEARLDAPPRDETVSEGDGMAVPAVATSELSGGVEP